MFAGDATIIRRCLNMCAPGYSPACRALLHCRLQGRRANAPHGEASAERRGAGRLRPAFVLPNADVERGGQWDTLRADGVAAAHGRVVTTGRGAAQLTRTRGAQSGQVCKASDNTRAVG